MLAGARIVQGFTVDLMLLLKALGMRVTVFFVMS